MSMPCNSLKNPTDDVFVWKMFIPPDNAELTRKKSEKDCSQDVQVVGRCTRVKQVSEDDLME